MGANSVPQWISPGPNGNLYFTDGAGRVGQITTSGTITEYTNGITGSPRQIIEGPDGNVWITESSNSSVGKFVL